MLRQPLRSTLFPYTTLFRSYRYFYDCEFIEDGRLVDLVSIGVVDEKGREFYAVSTEFDASRAIRSEEHTSELQSHSEVVCRLLLEKKIKAGSLNTRSSLNVP